MNDEVMHEDMEGQHARSELYRAAKMSAKLFKMIDDHTDLEPWVLAKAVKAADYLDSIYHYLEYQTKFADGSETDSIEDLIGDSNSLSKQIEDEYADLEIEPDHAEEIDDFDIDLDDLEDEDELRIKKESAYNEQLNSILESVTTHDEIKDKIMRSIRVNGIEKTIANVKSMINGQSISESEARVCIKLLKEAASCKKEAKARKEKRKVVVKPKPTKKEEKAKAHKEKVGEKLDEQVITESSDLQDILRLAGQKQLNG